MPYIDFKKLHANIASHPEFARLEAGEAEPNERTPEAKLVDDFHVALRELGDKQAEAQRVGADREMLQVVDNEMGSMFQSYLDEQLGSPQGVSFELNDLEVMFDSRDVPGWVKSFFTWRRGKGRHEWLENPGPPVRIPNRARIALLGDWGTGRYGAVTCANTIAAKRPAYDVLIHLGDVYYSGTRDEIQRRFLDVWPVVPGAISRACNSNHEMYAGGFGFFDMILPAFKQPASFFCLENDYYRIIGLDTGYDEGDLAGNQAAWVRNLVASAGNRKIVLLSHHQPYSLKEKNYTKITDKLQPLLDQKRIFAWYWGHEHRCVVYDRHKDWSLYGRCVGHSGFPYFRDKFSGPPKKINVDESRWFTESRDGVKGDILDGENLDIPGKADKYGPNGFAELELEPTRIVERILGADGRELLEWKLT